MVKECLDILCCKYGKLIVTPLIGGADQMKIVMPCYPGSYADEINDTYKQPVEIQLQSDSKRNRNFKHYFENKD